MLNIEIDKNDMLNIEGQGIVCIVRDYKQYGVDFTVGESIIINDVSYQIKGLDIPRNPARHMLDIALNVKETK